LYPDTYPHKVSSGLLYNYGADMRELYKENGKPGCRLGEVFITHHLRYISDLWNDAYNHDNPDNNGTQQQEQRVPLPKCNVSKTYGCHMEPEIQYYTCRSHDGPLATSLQEFVGKHPNTAVVLANDHGFHWGEGGMG